LYQKPTSSATTDLYNPGGADAYSIADGSTFSIWFWKEDAAGAVGTRTEFRLQNSSSSSRCNATAYGGNVYHGTTDDVGNYSASTWTHLEIQPVASSGCKFRVDGGSWSSNYANDGTSASPTRLKLYNFDTAHNNYFDNFQVDAYSDPRPGIALWNTPDDGITYNLVATPHSMLLTSSLNYTTYPGYTGTATITVEKNAVTKYDGVIDLTTDAICGGYYCAYVQNNSIDFVAGDYIYYGQICFDGSSCTAVADTTITVSASFAGYGAIFDQTTFNDTAEWGMSNADISNEMKSYPPVPFCSVWGTSDGDGLQCLTAWLRYMVVPVSYFYTLPTGTITGTYHFDANLLQATSGATAKVISYSTGYFQISAPSVEFDTSHVVTGTNPDGTTFTFTPPAASAENSMVQNLIGSSVGTLMTRWPFSYLLAFNSAISSMSSTDKGLPCPIPDLLGSNFTMLGHTTAMPVISVCDIIDANDIATTIEANTFADGVLTTSVYLFFAMLWYDMGYAFLIGAETQPAHVQPVKSKIRRVAT